MSMDYLTSHDLLNSVSPIKGYGLDRVYIQRKHEAIELPKEVGEELDKFKKTNGGLLEFVSKAGNCHNCYSDLTNTNHFAVGDYTNTEQDNESIGKLVDAWRYGWEAESEELFYVLGPESWENRNAVHDRQCNGELDTGIHFSDEGPSPLETPDEEYAFTRTELKQYQLDSDIFALVPVEEEK